MDRKPVSVKSYANIAIVKYWGKADAKRMIPSTSSISLTLEMIKKIFVDKLTQAQLINGRLAIARLLVDNNSEGEYAIIPASVADKIAQRDASSIVLHSALSAEEQDEDDPYADFKVPDDLMW